MFVNEVQFLALTKRWYLNQNDDTSNSKLNHEMIFTLISFFISAV